MNATSEQRDSVERFVDSLPAPQQIRERLTLNLREQRFLKQLLKLAEQRAKVEEAHVQLIKVIASETGSTPIRRSRGSRC